MAQVYNKELGNAIIDPSAAVTVTAAGSLLSSGYLFSQGYNSKLIRYFKLNYSATSTTSGTGTIIYEIWESDNNTGTNLQPAMVFPPIAITTTAATGILVKAGNFTKPYLFLYTRSISGTGATSTVSCIETLALSV
jgi:hypothetical protein